MDSLPTERYRTIHILRLPEVCRATGLGRSMVYQLEAMSQFPRRVKIGARAVGWIEEEVQSWLADRVTRSRLSNERR
ncbi:MAG: AlpA family phage regulatory protein [Steroidobacteraceae bacterium]